MLPKIEKLLKLAGVKHVKTPQGADLFNKPIGSVITGVPTTAKTTSSVSIVRLRSLQEALQIAKKAGEMELAKKIYTEFQSAVKQYSVGRTATQVLADLKATQPPAK